MNSGTILFYLSFILPLFEIVVTGMYFKLDNNGLLRDEKKVKQLIEKFFPYENNLCMIQLETSEEEYVPNFHVPVIAYTDDQMLEDCHDKL